MYAGEYVYIYIYIDIYIYNVAFIRTLTLQIVSCLGTRQSSEVCTDIQIVVPRHETICKVNVLIMQHYIKLCLAHRALSHV